MDVILKTVDVNNKDFVALVAELNAFFLAEWGTVATTYDHHHNLSTMKSALVAYVDGQAVGCGAWKLLDGKTPEVKRMFVKPTHRQFGIAHKLLDHLEAEIRANGFEDVVLETGAEMTGAIAFYQKNGYAFIPNYGEFIGDTRCVCMAKTFSKS